MDHELDAVSKAELAEHAANMRLDGRLAQVQALADLLVGEAVGDERRASVSRSEKGDAVGGAGCGRERNSSTNRRATEGASAASPGGSGPQRIDRLRGGGRLEEEPAGACSEAAKTPRSPVLTHQAPRSPAGKLQRVLRRDEQQGRLI